MTEEYNKPVSLDKQFNIPPVKTNGPTSGLDVSVENSLTNKQKRQIALKITI